MYGGLARRYPQPPVLLMRPLLNGSTLGELNTPPKYESHENALHWSLNGFA